MRFREYQDRALSTRQTPATKTLEPIVPLLGLAGEVGELLSEYKKQLRDGEAHTLFKGRVAEELGDLLWYIADVADIYGLDLEEVAHKNLDKCRARWGYKHEKNIGTFDADYPKTEQLPRRFDVVMSTITENGKIRARMMLNGEQLGNDLTDNAYEDDGYRFHDVFHLACAGMLGWSPVIRTLLKRKRKSVPDVDEVQDGGRAQTIEEGISALVFTYAQDRGFLADVPSVDYELLRTIKGMTKHLEVSVCTLREWEQVILKTYEVWRKIKQHGEGTVIIDLYQRTIHLKDQ
jgi:NTP pyrophosphatase (non-canonical NTP hydrolase)